MVFCKKRTIPACKLKKSRHHFILLRLAQKMPKYVKKRKNPLTSLQKAEYNVENTDAVPIWGAAMRKRVLTMKTWIALIALLALLVAAVPALGDIGDVPKSPKDHVPGNLYYALEHKRQVQAVGGVTGSPYWLWQSFVCGRSIDLRLFNAEHSVITTQMLFKQRLRFAEDGSGAKEMLLTLYKDADAVELRIGSDAFEMFERTGIERIIVRTRDFETLYTYDCDEIKAVFDYFQLGEDEYLCLQGDDAPMFAHSEDNIRRAVTR